MDREDPKDVSAADVSRYIREGWDSIPLNLKIAFIVFLDASYGLRNQSGIFSIIIHGDPLWIVQFFEYVLSSMYILFSIFNLLKGWLRNVFTIFTPVLILLIFAFCLDQLFMGQETTASTSFNLSSTFFSGLYWGSAYLSIAVGLTIIYKVQNFGNFAQAEMMLVGAYVGFTMMWSPFFYTIIDGKKVLNIDVPKDEVLTWDLLFWACVSGFVIAGLLGVLIDKLVYRRFRMKNALPQAMMIASLGVAMIMRGLLYLRYGAEQFLFVPDKDWRLSTSRTEFSQESQPFYGYWPDIMNQTVRFRFGERKSIKDHSNMDQTACIEESKLDNFSSTWDTDSGICTVTEYLPFFYSDESTYFLQYTKAALIIGVFSAVILLILMLNRTRLGRQMRAVADNPDLAASSGINVERVHAITAFLAAGMSGFGGVLFGMYVRVNPEVGLSILLPAFSVIVLGTLGSVRGALIASVIVGLVRSISEPILIGAGSELDRPSYAAFGEAMPYMFLIAVLMVMPKGLGHALNEWGVERAKRKKAWSLPEFSVPEVPPRITNLLNSFRFPENKFLSGKIKDFDKPIKGIVLILGIIQILIVSILDIYTSGQGTAYYLIDFIYLLLEIVGLFMIYFSLAHYQTDIKLYIIDVYFQVNDSSIEQRRILLGSGFFILFLFYGLDFLIGGVGTLYLALDYIFLIAQLFGLLMILFSLFLLVGSLGSILSPTKASDTTIYGFRSVNKVIRKTKDIIQFEKIWWEILHRINWLLIIVALLLLKYEPSIEPSSARDTESILYVTEIAYILIIFSFRDLTRFISEAIEPVQKVSGEFMKIAGNHVNFQALVFGILLVSFNHLFWGFILLLYSSNDLVKFASDRYSERKESINFEFLPKYGRASERGSWFAFFCFLVILIYIADWLPSVTKFTKTMQISRIIVLVCIFSILAIALNLHTGFTGMTNFGVIFFAGLGAITVAILTVPEERPGGHGWAPILGGIFTNNFGSAILAAVFVSGLAGWLLAYPTANLRMDYFAIVTISLGEIVRISMRAEPLLRAGTGTTAIGISLYNLPLEHWWESTMDDSVGEWLDLGQAAPYTVLLAVIALVSFASIWLIVEMIQASPWGRILRAIREDEEVTMHHGHNVFQHKAMCLALGAAIGGFGGALWAWLNSSVLDDFINPINSTFLIWAAFIVGGRANNRGMVIGAFIIALTQPFFNLLSAARGDTDSIFHDYISDIDGAFAWFFLDIMGIVSSDLSMFEVFGTTNPEKIVVNMTYFKLMLIGTVILSSLLISERGLLPEVPKRPENPDLIEPGIPRFVWAFVAAFVLILEIFILGVL